MPAQESSGAPSPQRVLCVSPMVAGFGVDTLVTAFGMLAADRPNLHLDLVGEGPLEEDLRAQVRALSLQDRIHFHGPASTEAAGSSSALVLPRRVEPEAAAEEPALLLDVLTGASAAPAVQSCFERFDSRRRQPMSLVVSADDAVGLAMAIVAVLEGGAARDAPRGGARRRARPPGRSPGRAAPGRPALRPLHR
ncbi:glycosyltransferase [Geodermatophilus sp. URMC 64]